MTRHNPLLFLLASTFTACAAPPPAVPAASAPLSCSDLGDRVNHSPLDEQSGKIAVEQLQAGDLDDYDRDESSVAPGRPVGARMSFGAPMGWTRPWLERWVACYREHNRDRAGTDPLAHDDSEIDVRSVSGAFAIDVVSSDRDLAQRIQSEALTYAQR